MKNQTVTYAEVNLAKTSKRQQRKPKGTASSTAVPEREEITYADLNLQAASQALQGNDRHYLRKELSSNPEKLLAGILGILCIILISTVIATVARNRTLKNDTLEAQTKENSCHHCPKDWITYDNNCYYYSMEPKTWNESVLACASNNSNLFYIDNETEMKFFSSISLLSWIDVFRESSDQPWRSRNGSAFNFTIKEPTPGKNCVQLYSSGLKADYCTSSQLYKCKHKL